MLKLHAAAFASLADIIARLDRFDPNDPNAEIEHDGLRAPLRAWVSAMMPGLLRVCDDLPLPSVKRQVDRIRNILSEEERGSNRSNQVQRLSTAVASLRERLQDDLLDLQFLHVPADLARFYVEPNLFGPAVAEKFPALAEDIESAGKCLALGLGTASVFHLMRVMEAAVAALATALGIENTERVWGMLLSDIDAAIKAQSKGPEWSEARANLYHVKQAWRNETMHPKQTYTPEQAREVFAAMKTFMAHLVDLV